MKWNEDPVVGSRMGEKGSDARARKEGEGSERVRDALYSGEARRALE
jgi:hypothetical protein